MERKNIILIIAIIFIAAAIFIIKRYLGEDNNCPKLAYTISATNILTGESIHFEDNTAESNTWKWEFGDGGTSDLQSGDYTYNSAGEFTIKITINGKCSETTSIKVKELIANTDTTQKAVTILGPASCRVGEAVHFGNNTSGATKWEWQFGESGNADRTEQNPTYTYNKPGNYTIVLLVDASKTVGRHQIIVTPKAPEAGKAPAPKLSGEDLKAKLASITKGDFDKVYYPMLKKYFCDNDHVDVVINGGQKKSIYSYCMQLDIQRNTQINDVKIDYQNDCISKVTVTQK